MNGLNPKKTIALDFDGTVVAYDHPNIGVSIGAEKWLRCWNAAGANIILNTMRSGELLGNAVQWFHARGIRLFGVQTHPGQADWTDSPKVYAKLYIDDHGYGVPLIRPDGARPYVDWETVGPDVLGALCEPARSPGLFDLLPYTHHHQSCATRSCCEFVRDSTEHDGLRCMDCPVPKHLHATGVGPFKCTCGLDELKSRMANWIGGKGLK